MKNLKRTSAFLVLISVFILITHSCKKEDEPQVPELTTLAVSQIATDFAHSGGNVIKDGGVPITSRGLVWGKSQNPTLESNDGFTVNGSGLGVFSAVINGLSPNTTYYVRAYSTNTVGNAYGNQQDFSTNAAIPDLTTTPVTELSARSAKSGGTVKSDGGAPITARGVCWGTSLNPTIAGSKTTDQSTVGEFISHLTDLIPNTKYYVRAYATNSKGTGYGSETTFITLAQPPTAVTLAATNLIGNSATLQSRVNANNSTTEVSFEFGTTSAYGQTVTTSISPIEGYTDIHINAGINELIPGTTYHYRVKAANSAGTTYGEEMTFTTPNIPVVSTAPVASVTGNSAITGGVVISDGGAYYLYSRGVCWNTTGNPIISDSRTIDGSSTGSFISTINGLLPNTVYYVRAYASSYVGTAYGNQLTFTTD